MEKISISLCLVLNFVATLAIGNAQPIELVLQDSAQPHQSAIASLAFSPDSTLLAAGCGIDASIGGWGDLNLFEVKSMTLIKTCKGYGTPVLAVAFAPDGKSVYRKSAREASGEDFDGGDEDEGFRGVSAVLVVLAEATEVVEPAEGALDYPSAGKDFEAGYSIRAADDLHLEVATFEALAHPIPQLLASVATVGPDALDAGERLVDLVEHQPRTIAVLHVRRVHAHLQYQTIGVHQQMTLSSHNLLSRIISAHSSPPSRSHALAIQYRTAWGFFLPRASRAASRSASCSLLHTPAALHFA